MLDSVREISLRTIIVVAVGIWLLVAALYFIAIDSDPILPPPPVQSRKTIEVAPEAPTDSSGQEVEVEIRESGPKGLANVREGTPPVTGLPASDGLSTPAQDPPAPRTAISPPREIPTPSGNPVRKTPETVGQPEKTPASTQKQQAVRSATATPSRDLSKGDFLVQAGAFKTEAKARSQAADVEAQGFRTRILKGGDGLFRIQLGPFDKAEAERAVQRLQSAGIQGFVKPVGR